MAFKSTPPPRLVVLEDGTKVEYPDAPVGARYRKWIPETGTTGDDTFVVTEKRDYLADWAAGHRALFYDHVKPEIRALCERPERVTLAEYMELRANSYERRILHQRLDDEALLWLAEYCMGQAGRSLGEFDLPEHYNDAVEREIAPLLAKRLREAATQLAGLKKTANTVLALATPGPWVSARGYEQAEPGAYVYASPSGKVVCSDDSGPSEADADFMAQAHATLSSLTTDLKL